MFQWKFFRLHFRPKTPPAVDHVTSGESSDSDWDQEAAASRPLPESTPTYPFPSEATSICVDVESERPGDDPPFTSEFNIADYFTADAFSDLEMAVASVSGSSSSVGSEQQQQQQRETAVASSSSDIGGGQSASLPVGCSRFTLSPATGSFARIGGGGGVSSATTSGATASATHCTIVGASPSTTTLSSMGCAAATVQRANEVHLQDKQQQQHHQKTLVTSNNSGAPSILSKSLTSPSNHRSNAAATGSAATRTAAAVGYVNGPAVAMHNSASTNNLPNNSHVVNSQSTLLLPQKHPPSSLLPVMIAQTKLASIARQQSPQTQTQQNPSTGEITLNSNNRWEVFVFINFTLFKSNVICNIIKNWNCCTL